MLGLRLPKTDYSLAWGYWGRLHVETLCDLAEWVSPRLLSTPLHLHCQCVSGIASHANSALLPWCSLERPCWQSRETWLRRRSLKGFSGVNNVPTHCPFTGTHIPISKLSPPNPYLTHPPPKHHSLPCPSHRCTMKTKVHSWGIKISMSTS